MAFDKKEMKGNASASRADWEEGSDLTIPDGYECPITGEIMQNPVMAADGHSYEKAAIEEWFRKGNHRSPLTGEKLPHHILTPNWNLKKLITAFLAKRPKEQEFADSDSKPVVSKQEQHAKLVRAAAQGRLDEVNQLLAAGVDVDIEIKETGYTPLFAAASARDSAVFERLLEAKANVKITDDGWTLAQQVALTAPWPTAQKRSTLQQLSTHGVSLLPIHEAATLGDDKAIINERQKGQGKIKDVQDSNVLHYASANGQLAVLQRFIKTDATLLQWIDAGEPGTARWLLTEGGLAPQEPDKNGNTALLRAAANGHPETVEWLLTHSGAKITEKNKNDTTALLWAAQEGQLATVQWLLAHGGAKITEKDKYGNTALLLAAAMGQLATVQWLLAHGGAKITEKNNNGSTALLVAACYGELATVQWLLAHGGASIREKDNDGSTALLVAACYGELATVQWLLAHGAAITEKTKNGKTALLLAARYGELETVQWLLTHGGAKITEKDKNGDTALLVAACDGQLATVQWLLCEGGANITEKNNRGRLAIDLASTEELRAFLKDFKPGQRAPSGAGFFSVAESKSGPQPSANIVSGHSGSSSELSGSKHEEELIERLSILTAQRDRIHTLKSGGHSHSKLDKEQDEMDKQISGVENELQNVRSKQSERRDNQNWTALGSSSSSTTSSSLPQAPRGGKK